MSEKTSIKFVARLDKTIGSSKQPR